MSETKEEIAAQRDALQAENENLRGQLAAAGATRGLSAPAAHRFFLTEGDRQELELKGVANIGGRLMTTEQVLAKLAEQGETRVEIADASPAAADQAAVTLAAHERQERGGQYGVDYVYPSVAPGVIDPAVAGTPGINGPTADQAKA